MQVVLLAQSEAARLHEAEVHTQQGEADSSFPGKVRVQDINTVVVAKLSHRVLRFADWAFLRICITMDVGIVSMAWRLYALATWNR